MTNIFCEKLSKEAKKRIMATDLIEIIDIYTEAIKDGEVLELAGK